MFRRADTAENVSVELDLSSVPGDPQQRPLLMAIMQGSADEAQRTAFGTIWQDRVRRLLLEHADDPDVVQVRRPR